MSRIASAPSCDMTALHQRRCGRTREDVVEIRLGGWWHSDANTLTFTEEPLRRIVRDALTVTADIVVGADQHHRRLAGQNELVIPLADSAAQPGSEQACMTLSVVSITNHWSG